MQRRQNQCIRCWAHIVPATRVLTCVVFGGRSFANPKSEIFGVRWLSRRTLLAFISLCTIRGRTSSWRKARPRATPMQILDRVSQLKCMLLWPPPDENRQQETEWWLVAFSADFSSMVYDVTKKRVCKAVVLKIIVDQNPIVSLHTAPIQPHQVFMRYAGDNFDFIQELPYSLFWLYWEHLYGNNSPIFKLPLQTNHKCNEWSSEIIQTGLVDWHQIENNNTL